MSSEGRFQISLPSLDDDDSEEQLFSYPAPRFGHPAKASSLSTYPNSSSNVPPSSSQRQPYEASGFPSSTSTDSMPLPWGSQQYGHSRGLSAASSSEAYSGSMYGGGRKDSVAASATSGEIPAWMGFGSGRKDSIAASQYSAGDGPSAFGQQGGARRDTAPKQVQKKGSFVSLKSAFSSSKDKDKAGKTSAVPPLPDSAQAYPALRNPFTRSSSAQQGTPSLSTPATSSAQPTPKNRSRRTSTATSATQNSSSAAAFWNVGQSKPTHRYGPANYSTASSTFAFGSNSSISSPPPLPSSRRNLSGHGGGLYQQQGGGGGHMRSLSSLSQAFPPPSSVVSQMNLPPPSTPPQFAIHLLLRLFTEITTSHIQSLLSAINFPLRKGEPIFARIIGPGVDEDLDRTLESLGMAAALGGGGGPKPPGAFGGQRGGPQAKDGAGDAKFVVDNLVKWRNELLEEEIEKGTVRSHMTGVQSSVADVERRLKDRRALATLYLLFRVTCSIVKHTPSKDVLGEAFGIKLEDMLWRYVVKETSMESIRRSENRSTNRKLLLEVIGKLSTLRFETLTDRFLTELKRGVKLGTASSGSTMSKGDREAEARLETIMRAMENIELKVYPATEFDMGADFLSEVAGYFAQTHGSTLKIAYAETLLKIIHPLADTLTAEVNHPIWAKAISTILAQAQKMLKDKYWHVGYPLAVVALCVSPREVFREHWLEMITTGLARIKEKERPHARPIVANAILRLMWVYLNRCTEESNSAITKNLDTVVQAMFPPRQRHVQPSDISLDVFTAILHFITLRQFDYGRELIFQLLMEERYGEKARGSISAGSEEVSAPERFTVAIRAVLLTLRAFEKDIKTPNFPTSSSFAVVTYGDDFPTSGETLPEAVLARAGVSDCVDRLNPILSVVALIMDHGYGSYTLFDDGASTASQTRSSEPFGDGGFYNVQHGLLRCRIRNEQRPFFNLLQSVFDAWPRILRSSIGIHKTLQIISRGIAHVDPSVAAAATAALKRVAVGQGRAEAVAAGYARFLTGDRSIHRAHQVGVKAYESEMQRLVQTWVDVLDIWLQDLQQVPDEERIPVNEDTLAELDATALFFLASVSVSIRKLAVDALQKLGQIQDYSAASDDPPERVISFLESAGRSIEPPTVIPAAALTAGDSTRLESYTRSVPADFILQWAESDHNSDEHLWYLCYPEIVQRLQLRTPDAMRRFRSLVGRRFLDWKSDITETARRSASLAPSTSSALAQSTRPTAEQALPEQWRIFVTVLCATTTPTGDISTPSSSSIDASAPPIDVEAERLSSSKHLFQQVIHFLYSENALFRDAAVTALGHIAQPTLNDLLDTLQRITSHIYDAAQAPVSRSKPMTPTQTRILQPQTDITDLYTAAAHVFERISPLIKDTRSLGDLKLMAAVIQFVDRTLRYLSERTDNPHLHPLRRYFCIVVQNLADGVVIVGDPSRHLGSELRASIFKICDQWSNLGRRAEVAQARESKLLSSIDDAVFNSRDRSSVIATVSNQGKELSVAAANAMAALCQGPLFNVPTAPTRGVDADGILAWVRSLFLASNPSSHEVGRKALSSLLQHNGQAPRFMKEVMQQTFNEGDNLELSRSFFTIVVTALLGNAPPDVSYAQRAALVLVKLAHPDIGVRRRALDLLSASVLPESTFFARFYPTVGSSAPVIYLRAQREVADKLASIHQSEAVAVLSELTLRLTQVDPTRRLILLRLFPSFLACVDCSAPSANRTVLVDILFIAIRFGDGFPQEMQQIWLSLACGPFPRNCSEIIKFLLQQASRRNTLEFVMHARNVVACLSASSVGHTVYEDLCAFIDPTAMVQTPDVEDAQPPADNGSVFKDHLDSLFPLHPKAQALSTGRLALLFVGEMMTDPLNCPDPGAHLTNLLHATLSQVDHPYAPIREQAQSLLFQILWTSTANFDAAVDAEDWEWVKLGISNLWNERHTLFWTSDSQLTDDLNIPRKMNTLVPELLDILEPFFPDLRHAWGALAVHWGTSCPDRQLACRSFQIFRVLSPEVTPRMLADMIGRLSNTLADSVPGNNVFCQELLWGFSSIVRSMEAENLLAFPQIFWCAAASLSTTVEEEFAIALELLTLILDRLDLNNQDVVSILLENQPPHWSPDDLRLQKLLIPGLRSCKTDQATFDLMCRLASIERDELIDCPEDRTMHLFISSLPWCLIAMDDNDFSPEIIKLAEDLSRIAASEGKVSIQRLMLSFAKNRFRTKDDFLRGAVSSIREHFLPRAAFEAITMLLGFVLNQRDFMREKTLIVLKLVLQATDVKDTLNMFGAELLMPLLRLIGTKLAPQALEVLSEQANTTTDALDAVQVLRMSMSFNAAMHNLQSFSGEVFGIPFESGWCVAKADEQSASARQNALAVFETCPQGARIQSSAHFSMQFQDGTEFYPNTSQLSLADSATPSQVTEEITLGELVGDLHTLNKFFDDIDEEEEVQGYTFARNTSVADSIGSLTVDPTERRVNDVLRRSARTPSISSIREFEARRLTSPSRGASPTLFPPPPSPTGDAPEASPSPDSPVGHGHLATGRGSDADRRPSHQKDGLVHGNGFESDDGGGGSVALGRAFDIEAEGETEAGRPQGLGMGTRGLSA